MVDDWGSAEAYEPYVGRWSRAVADEFLPWLAVPSGARWLEVGCGTGALTQAICEKADPARLLACDPSEAYLAYNRARTRDARASFALADATNLPSHPDRWDAVVSGLVLNFLPDPAAGIGSMAGRLRAGGLLGAYVWDYAARMELMRRFWDTAVASDPRAEALDEGRRFPLCQPDALRALFEEADLEAVETRAIDVPTSFRDFDDYWMPFLGGQGPAPGYVRSLEEDARARLRERVRSALPTEPDGSIHLVARAWAVRGRRPDGE